MKALEKEHENIRREIKENYEFFDDSEFIKLLNEKYTDDLAEALTNLMGNLRMIVFPPDDTDDIRVSLLVDDLNISSAFSLKGAIEYYAGGYDEEEKGRIKTALLNIAESLKI